MLAPRKGFGITRVWEYPLPLKTETSLFPADLLPSSYPIARSKELKITCTHAPSTWCNQIKPKALVLQAREELDGHPRPHQKGPVAAKGKGLWSEEEEGSEQTGGPKAACEAPPTGQQRSGGGKAALSSLTQGPRVGGFCFRDTAEFILKEFDDNRN